MENYYYQSLNGAARSVYTAMLNGMTALAPEIRVLLLPQAELSDVYFRVKLDHPMLFYVSGFSYRMMPGADYAVLLPQYEFKPDRIRSLRDAVNARLDRLLRPAKGMSPAEKELYIHDFILNNVHYDKLKKYYSHEEVVKAMEEELGAEITFERCALSEDEMIRVRERINKMIAEKVK